MNPPHPSTRRDGTISVGRVTQLLLDTDIHDNDDDLRGVTDRLYGGGGEHRLLQELLLGIGGVLAEAIADVTFRPAPVSREQAADMIDSLRTQKFLGPFRGDAAVDRDELVDCLLALSQVAVARTDITSVDINPLIVTSNGRIVAVDALVELGERGRLDSTSRRFTAEQFRALFDPKGVLVTGASTHPGKFGFVSLHNILASGYEGAVYGTNLSGEEVLGVKTVGDIDALPDNAIDLVFVCTPAAANAAAALLARVDARLSSAASVILSDYAKGLLTPALLREVISRARRAGVPVLVDPKGSDFTRYNGASLLTPNRSEAFHSAGLRAEHGATVAEAGSHLLASLDVDALLITEGEAGMTLFERGGSTVHLPASARVVFDVTGAGDAVIATLGLALAAGGSLREATYLANLAGGLAVEQVGTATLTAAAVEEALLTSNTDVV